MPFGTQNESFLRQQPGAPMGHVHKENTSCCAVHHCSTVEALQQRHSLSLLQQAAVMALSNSFQDTGGT